MAKSSHSHFIAVTRALSVCARERDLRKLEAYVQSDAFVQHLAAMNSTDRVRVARSLTEAQLRCRERLDQMAPLPPRGSVRVRWKGNDELIAKLRRLAPLYPRDEDLARKLGIPLRAAIAGRYRYAGRKSVSGAAPEGTPTIEPRAA